MVEPDPDQAAVNRRAAETGSSGSADRLHAQLAQDDLRAHDRFAGVEHGLQALDL
jgi:hypothetical protein